MPLSCPETTDNAAASVDALADDAEHGASNEAAAAHADAPALETGLTRDKALDLLKKYNEDPSRALPHCPRPDLLKKSRAHALLCAEVRPGKRGVLGQVGLLHDLDWEKFQDEVSTP